MNIVKVYWVLNLNKPTLTQPCSPFKAPWGPFFITAKSVTEFNFFLSALLCATEKAILKVINVFFLC